MNRLRCNLSSKKRRIAVQNVCTHAQVLKNRKNNLRFQRSRQLEHRGGNLFFLGIILAICPTFALELSISISQYSFGELVMFPGLGVALFGFVLMLISLFYRLKTTPTSFLICPQCGTANPSNQYKIRSFETKISA
jgi:hypothetical protein